MPPNAKDSNRTFLTSPVKGCENSGINQVSLDVCQQGSYGAAPQMDSATVKICAKCGEHKELSDFYKKGSRFDARCKQCILEGKRAVPKANPAMAENKRKQVQSPKKRIQAKHAEDKTDYRLWEDMYQRSLSNLEKMEIRTNLSAFFSVLINAERKRMRDEKDQ